MNIINKKNILLILSVTAALFISSCTERYHIAPLTNNTSDGDLGIEGVMPIIGSIYKEKVEIGSEDGNADDMLKAHLIYTITADIIVDNLTALEGGNAKCLWEANVDDGIIFKTDNSTGVNVETELAYNAATDTYECKPVTAEFTRTGYERNYNPDGQVRVKFKDNTGTYLPSSPWEKSPYILSVLLNTADRHNIVDVITSPSSVLFRRNDGLFQAGFTAYRGMLGLQSKIGSAVYEAKIKSPGGTKAVSLNDTTNTYSANVIKDTNIINSWLTDADNVTVQGSSEDNGIYSRSAFVSSYGPPIALPAFRKDLPADYNYNRLRNIALKNGNYPVIITDDKKLYTMGSVSNFTGEDLLGSYQYQIRKNDSWFQYSGINVSDNPDFTKLHIGEIKAQPLPDGTVPETKFVNILSITADLVTIIALNEVDKEYYIAGNPLYNNGFCSEKSFYNNETTAFNNDTTCTYSPLNAVGAVKIKGLQKLIGSGETATATDVDIHYIGRDGFVYKVDLKPDSQNYINIKAGASISSSLVVIPVKGIDNETTYLRAIDVALANMNHALSPTYLLEDGSIYASIRYYEPANAETGAEGKVAQKIQHFYINSNLNQSVDSKKDYIKIVKLLGPSSGYGEDGEIYFWTDVASLGISYDVNTAETDKDYLAYISSDPVSLMHTLSEEERGKFFKFYYSRFNFKEQVKALGGNSIDNNFAILPYNPYNEQREEFLDTGNGTITTNTLPYRPYKTNSFLIANLSSNADYSYIYLPYYFYGYDNQNRINPDTWIMKKDGLAAAEVKNNNISKIYRITYDSLIPFRYTKNSRNTIFFANKKGVFTFVDYNVRKQKSSCPNGDASCLNDKFKTSMPDYFYRALIKDTNGNMLPTANTQHKYYATSFISEVRMSNYPDNKNYCTTGFIPQLLSSYMLYEYKETPDTTISRIAAEDRLPGYIPQWFYANKSETLKNIFTDLTSFMKGGSSSSDNMYQFQYGAGAYRKYQVNVLPAWRAKKANTETLQYLSRYGIYIPLPDGDTANSYYGNWRLLFEDNKITGETDLVNYITERIYSLGLYSIYDKANLSACADLGTSVFGNIENNADTATADISTNNIGYVMDNGNFMWRNQPVSTIGTGNIPLTDFDFVAYH